MSHTFSVYVNPMMFFGLDDPFGDTAATAEGVLAALVSPGTDASVDAMRARAKALTEGSGGIFAAPHEKHILEKLVWPLRHAKASYCLGNYLGTIALVGMVSEMVAMTWFEATPFVINGNPMDDEAQKAVWGSTFEKLGQDRRVTILRAYGVINDDLRKSFDEVRLIRRKYLHLASQGHDRIEDDARAAFGHGIRQVAKLIGQDVRDGKILLSPVMVRYLSSRGLLRPADEPEKT